MQPLTRIGLLSAVLTTLVLPLRAETTTAADPAPDAEVTVVVTAERRPQPVSESIATTTIITAKKMQETGAQTVGDALRLVPGVTLRQSGQPGSLTNAAIRGSNTNHVLVLVDGQRMSSPTFFSTDLSKFPASQVARIEVIRGPVSSLYGSDAIGGVINIITKQPTTEGGEITAGYGTHGREARSLILHGVASAMKWQFGGDFPAYDGKRLNSDFASTGFFGRLIFPNIKEWSVAVRGEDYADRLGLPGADPYHTGAIDPDDRAWWDRRNSDITATRELAGGELELRVTRNMQRLHNLAPGGWAMDSYIRGITNGTEATFRAKTGTHQWLVGGDYRNEAYQDRELGAPTVEHNVFNRALFAQDRVSLGDATGFVYGARLDDHSTAGSKVTPRLGIEHALGNGTHLRASYAEGFRAPNFSELYYPGWGGGWAGNPNLQPERSRQYEVGVRTHRDFGNIDLAFFTTNVSDLIQASSTTPYQNIGRARKRGVEVGWDRHFGPTALALSYNYLDAINRTTSERLPGLMHNKIDLTLTRQLAVYDMALTGRWYDSRLDYRFDVNPPFAQQTVALPTVTVFDLSISRRGGLLQPYAVVRNVLNADYEEVLGYPAERRSIEVGMRAIW